MPGRTLTVKAGWLIGAVSLAVLQACGLGNTKALITPPAALATIPRSPEWPKAEIGDPSRLGFSTDGLQALDARMKEAVARREIAGISYSLVRNGEVAALRHIGEQSLGGRPLDANTLFRVRSTGKTITAVAMMKLWEEGKWKPEDPVTKFLPELANLKVATSANNLENLVPAARAPTMHELMTHTAGFGYGLFPGVAADRALREKDVLHAKDMKAFVDEVAGSPLLSQPGDRWFYSVAYDLQGAIIARITGKTLGAYLEESIFKPLAMSDTGFWLTDADRPRLATVYTRNTTTGELEVYKDADNFLADDPFRKGSHFESGGGAASGLISTLHDMTRFTQMLVNRGELGGNRVLNAETVDFMMQNHIGDMKGVMGGEGYGFGYGGRVVVNGSTQATPQPNGSFSHFSIEGAWFWVDPRNKIGFVGLIQRRGGGGRGAVPLGGEGDPARLVYQALVNP